MNNNEVNNKVSTESAEINNYDPMKSLLENLWELLPTYHREVMELKYGENGNPDLTFDEVCRLLNESCHMRFKQDHIQMMLQESLHMIAISDIIGNEAVVVPRLYDTWNVNVLFPRLSWKIVDEEQLWRKSDADLKAYLKERFNASAVLLPTLTDLYEYLATKDYVYDAEDLDDFTYVMSRIVPMLTEQGKVAAVRCEEEIVHTYEVFEASYLPDEMLRAVTIDAYEAIDDMLRKDEF